MNLIFEVIVLAAVTIAMFWDVKQFWEIYCFLYRDDKIR